MPALPSLILNDISMPLFGVPLTVLGMAAAGAFASFAYGPHEASRKRLFFLAIANTFMAAVAVAILPVWRHWDWMTPVLQPPVAAILAFFARWAIPLFVELAPQWIRNWIGSLGQSKNPTSGDAP